MNYNQKNFGGVFNWEYFDSPPDKNIPETWAIEMNKVLYKQQSNSTMNCLIQ